MGISQDAITGTDPIKLQRSHASVSNAINSLKARKMNVNEAAVTLYSNDVYALFVTYNSSSNTFYGYCINLLNAMVQILIMTHENLATTTAY